MPFVRWIVAILGLLEGGYMLVDGVHALTTGTYFSAGAAGALGPWASVVSAVGIIPVSHGMEVAFVCFGAAYVVAVVFYALRPVGGSTALGVVAVATLWYLPVGTLLSVLVVTGLLVQRRFAARELSSD